MPINPNLFIVGAPKCGTTSLYEHFRQHPDVFMPHDDGKFWHHKEPSFFADDLDISPAISIQNHNEYLSIFNGSEDYRYRGDASALYMCSEVAAERIHTFNPDARIIIMIRHPVEFLYSWYIDCVRYCHEDIMSFSGALAKDSLREAGQALPRKTFYPRCLNYRKMATFSTQIKRYQSLFPANQIGLFLLDDMRDDPQAFFSRLSGFLDIDPALFPDINSRFHVSPTRLRTTLRHERIFYDALLEIPGSWRLLLKIRKLLKPVDQMANRYLPHIGDSFDDEMKERLYAEFATEIATLSTLFQRDLSHWGQTKSVTA